ncbi:hypothetical protein G9A89_016642 [Geosiphon pyriformis]|nr:hypothetical protein G9A89_016642 [Geosiphon pyriformis]
MGDYSYLSQQSEEHLAAYNRNNLEFIELNSLPSCLICFPVEEQSSRQFQDFWNWFLNKHSAEIYTAYTIYYFDQAYFENNFEERNTTENPFETEEKSYQTASIFDIFSSELEHSTQTVTPEPMAQNPIKANILAALQDPIKWLDDFEKAATANQYNDEYKFQIVGGYLQDSPATWFSQETDANAHQRIIR